MRICYQIQSHRAPQQLYRLVDVLLARGTDSLVVVDHDRHGPPLDPDRLTRHGEAILVSSEGGYGDWSHVRRYLDVCELLAERDVHYDWMVNISGQDYPARPMDEIEHELAATTADGFLRHVAVQAGNPRWRRRAHSRYWFHHRRLAALGESGQRRLRPLMAINRIQPVVRVHVAPALSIGWRAATPFGPDFICYGGHFYCSLRRACVDYIRSFTAERPDIVAHYQALLAPDESYFHTVLVNSGRFELVNDPKRYVDFQGSRFFHPRTLGLADVDPARASGAHFSRKWDMASDPAAFEAMDAYLYGPTASD